MDKVDIVEKHGKKRHTAHRGKRRHSAAAWKNWTKWSIMEKCRHSRSSVETTVIAQQRGKISHSATSWKRYRHSAAALKRRHSGAS